MTPEEFDKRLRKIEETLIEIKGDSVHHGRELEIVKRDLEDFTHLARQCESIGETQKILRALHSRVDEMDRTFAVMRSQHDQCMKVSDRDNTTLQSIQKDLIEVKMIVNQVAVIKNQADTNRMDIESLKMTVGQLASDNKDNATFVRGRVANLVDTALKLIIAAMIGWYMYTGGTITKPIEHKVTYPTDDAHDIPMLNDFKKEFEAHKADDARRFIETGKKFLQDQKGAKPTP